MNTARLSTAAHDTQAQSERDRTLLRQCRELIERMRPARAALETGRQRGRTPAELAAYRLRKIRWARATAQNRPAPRLDRLERDPERRSWILPAEAMAALASAPSSTSSEIGPRRRRRGRPDVPMVIARALVAVAAMSAETGHEWIDAGPTAIARWYAQRTPTFGGMKAAGMSVRNISRHWPDIARYLRRAADGRRVALRRTRRFHALEPAALERAVCHLTSPALRMVLGSLDAWAAGRDAATLTVSAQVGAGRTGQSPSRWCRAVREARIAGLVTDTRPARRITRRPDGTVRHPTRQIIPARTALVPLARDAIRWHGPDPRHTSPTPDGPRQMEHEAKGHSELRGDHAARSAAPQVAEAPRDPAHAPGPERTAGPELTADASSEPTSSPPSPEATTAREATSATDHGQWLKGARGRIAVRRHLVARELPGADTASNSAIDDIKAAVGTLAVLDRVLGKLAADLANARRPTAYLAEVCRGERQAIRSLDWRPRSARADGDEAELVTDLDRAVDLPALDRLADEPAELVSYARAIRERAAGHDAIADALERRADELARVRLERDAMERATATAAAWPAWQAVRTAARRELTGARRLAAAELADGAIGVRWRGADEAVLVTPNMPEPMTELAEAVARDTAELAAEALAQHTGTPYRVTLETADGRRLSSAAHPRSPNHAPTRHPRPGPERHDHPPDAAPELADHPPDADQREGDPVAAVVIGGPVRRPAHAGRDRPEPELADRPGPELADAREPRRPRPSERERLRAQLEATVRDRGPGWRTAERVLATLGRRP